jgi:hypothetical protein
MRLPGIVHITVSQFATMKYKMRNKPWWTITYLDSGLTYNSEQISFGELPWIQEINVHKGHRFSHSNIVLNIADKINIEFRSGAIWIDHKLVKTIPDADRIILKKRTRRDMVTIKKNGNSDTSTIEVDSAGASHQDIYTGLANSNGQKYIVCLTHTNDILIDIA